MKEIKEYKIAASHSPDELANIVNKMISEGWQPLGGVAILAFALSGNKQQTISNQAMVKYSQ